MKISSSDHKGENPTLVLAGGICALMAAMGIGRFAYTPILPRMQAALPFSDSAAGLLASVNFAGYLAGAMVTIFLSPARGVVTRLRLSLLVNIVTTAGMGMTDDFRLWAVLRFLSGFSSAGVFVLASGVVLDVLARHRRTTAAGLLYGGVGAGIALTGLTVPLLDRWWGWQGTWLGLAALATLLGGGVWRWLADHHPAGGGGKENRPEQARERSFLPWLSASYFLEGLGYVVTGTFLVALVQRATGIAGVAAGSWIIVGLAAVPSCTLWAWLARRTGFATALVLAHFAQAAGIALPVLLPNAAGAFGSALLFGGTMLGIVTLALGWGRTLLPHQTSRVVGVLTTAFGAGQILGPAAAGWLAERTSGFSLPLLAAAGVVALGGLLIPAGMLHTSRCARKDSQGSRFSNRT